MGKRLIFVGAGAVGSFVGGMLALAKEEVTLIDAWPEHIAKIKKAGLRITGTQGEHVVAINALHIHEIQGLLANPFDVAFLCTKSYDTGWAAALIRDYLSPTGLVVSLQNGFNDEAIAKSIDPSRVLGCIASTLGVEIQGPGHVARTYSPGSPAYNVFRVGELHGRVTSRVDGIVELLGKVDSATSTNNLWGERWSKIVANSISNPLSAITGLRDKEMGLNPDVRRLSIRLGAEAVAVGQALGYSLVPIFGIEPGRWVAAGRGEGLEQLDIHLTKVAERATDQGRPSTPLDIQLGRRTELDFFNGLIIAKGKEVGIVTPVHEEVLKVAKLTERGVLEPKVSNLDRLKGIAL